MANINIETGRERITINSDPDKVIELNLSDGSIITRLEKAKAEIDEFFGKIKDIADKEDKESAELISDTEKKIREKIDYIFDYPVSDVIFGNASCISTKNGVTFFERAINALMPLYEKAIKTEQKKSLERTEKYTKKYKK